MGINEIKELMKGHKDLGSSLTGQSLRTIGKRHALRLMSDAYGKGIVRGQAENTNLRAYNKENKVTSAECIMTAQTEKCFTDVPMSTA